MMYYVLRPALGLIKCQLILSCEMQDRTHAEQTPTVNHDGGGRANDEENKEWQLHNIRKWTAN
jgi:hypothetical protein